MITIKELAKQLSLQPTTLRRRLRAMEGLSHAKKGTWTWAPGDAELERIRKELAPLKKAKKTTTKKVTKS